MPVFDYSVKKNGKWYRPGEEIPETMNKEKFSEGTGEFMEGIEVEVGETATLEEPKPRKKKV